MFLCLIPNFCFCFFSCQQLLRSIILKNFQYCSTKGPLDKHVLDQFTLAFFRILHGHAAVSHVRRRDLPEQAAQPAAVAFIEGGARRRRRPVIDVVLLFAFRSTARAYDAAECPRQRASTRAAADGSSGAAGASLDVELWHTTGHGSEGRPATSSRPCF